MDELKAQESEALDILEAMLDVCDLDNPGPMFAGQHVRGGICKIMDDDVAKLRQYIASRRAAPENKALTNADRIRSMSDEELTRFIQSDLPIFRTFGEQLNWLNQPYASKPEGDKP